ncbi:GGDEF domain-containing protein [Pectobacterium brasiliense]|uniref:sensor domain-containing diguanylate cyclase n=1 Tax=Pectobacterium brasiliense TaxID=180957 RepID=UPI001969B809|nr:sensor domain-containing diguanylate cyclase [Pectobacterium brasiliense]MBN3343623.1 GGDEF domain-containing protein [Pectobacterium brasiliense]
MESKKIRLRTILTSLTVMAVMLTALFLLVALSIFQKSNIQNSLIQNNIAYARKLADTIDRYLTISENELKWSATQIKELDYQEQLTNEAERVRLQSGFFNSVVIVDKNRMVKVTSPDNLNLTGKKLTSDASLLAVTKQTPFISEPFISASGNYVIFISHPIFSDKKEYIGYIGGTIYLKKHSVLSEILTQHFHSSSSEIKIIDNDGMIIYSYNPDLVGSEEIFTYTIINQINEKENGRLTIIEDGEKHQGSYATLSKADWSIFIFNDEDEVFKVLLQTAKETILYIIAIILLIGCLMVFLGRHVATPIEKLANIVRDSNIHDSSDRSLNSVQVWYFEADKLKDAVRQHLQQTYLQVNELTDVAMKDPLTGIFNRRGFNSVLTRLPPSKFMSVIAIDIDHFKNVNDQYGHDAGDAVLVMLSDIIRKTCREDDIPSRFGGEEFIILLPGLLSDEAVIIAERLRLTISSSIFPHVGNLTVSAGVACISDSNGDVTLALRRADEALYHAKESGRNMVVLATENAFIRHK